MKKFFEKFFKIYADELPLFLWVTVLFFTVTAADMLLNNYAETVFLKRYGVKKLPNIYLINAVITFIIMNYIMMVLKRMSTIRLLRLLFLICPLSVMALRFFLNFSEIVYPLYYILKTQYETLLLLMFWNMSNELFSTRQSKRIFPVIMAGGVLGRITGSFCTQEIAKLIQMDNIVFVYGAMLFLSCLVTLRLEHGFTVFGAQRMVKSKKKKSNFIEEIKAIVPLTREYKLFKILVIVTLMGNLMIPLFNYQFNYVVDRTFVSESSLIDFFSWFRSAFNGISFILLLVGTGRFFSFFGLTTAVIFHPANYVIVFLAVLFHFKIGSAIYGRVSTNVLRSALNAPSLAAIMGLFPGDVGNNVRPLLRGTVVRIGTFAGSLILIGCADIISPKYLSILGAIFGLIWVGSVLHLRRNYVEIVLNLLLQKRIDFDTIGQTDLKALFRDSRVTENLLKSFQEEKGDEAVWYAELLKLAGVPDLPRVILKSLPEKEERAQRRLIQFIRADLGQDHFPVMESTWTLLNPSAQPLFMEVMAAIPYEDKGSFFSKIIDNPEAENLRYAALLGLSKSPDAEDRRAATQALSDLIPKVAGKEIQKLMNVIGLTGNRDFVEPLLRYFEDSEDGLKKAYILGALDQLGYPKLNDLVVPIIESSTPVTPLLRKKAIQALQLNDEKDIEEAVKLLSSRHRKVRRLMLPKIAETEAASVKALLSCMTIPKRDVREEVLEIIRKKGISERELQEFVNERLYEAYRNVFTLDRFRQLKDDPIRAIIIQKLQEDTNEIIGSVLYTLELQYESFDLRRIRRIFLYHGERARSNSVEALEGMLSSNLAQRMVPLIDDIPEKEKGRKGKKFFPIVDKPTKDIKSMVDFVLKWADPILAGCVVNYAVKAYPEENWEATLSFIENVPFGALRESAKFLLNEVDREEKKVASAKKGVAGLSVMDKILHLKKIQIFSDLKINELAAIAAIAKESKYEENETVMSEGDLGDSFYLLIEGEVAVIKRYGEDDEVTLAALAAGEYFGEMALFEAKPRSATIRTLQRSHFLYLDKEEFEDLVEEYPKIALNIGRVLSNRLREVHGKILEKDSQPLQENG